MPFGKTWGGLLNDVVSHPLDTASSIISAPQKVAKGFGNVVQGAVDKATPYAMEGAMRGFGVTPEIMDFYDKNVSQYNPVEDAMGGRMEYEAPPQNLAQQSNPFEGASTDDMKRLMSGIDALGAQKESFGPAGDVGAVAPSDTPEPVDIAKFEDFGGGGDISLPQKATPDAGIDIKKALSGVKLDDVGGVGAQARRPDRDLLLKMAGIETDSARDARIAKESERPELRAGGKIFKNPEEQGVSASDQMRRYQAIANDPAFSGTPQQLAAKRALAGSDLRTRVANEKADAAKAAQTEEASIKTAKMKGELGAQEDAAKAAALERKLKEYDVAIKYATTQDEIDRIKAQARQTIADSKVATETAGERIRGEKLKNENIVEDNREKAAARDLKERQFKQQQLMDQANLDDRKQKDLIGVMDKYDSGFKQIQDTLDKRAVELANSTMTGSEKANAEKKINVERENSLANLAKNIKMQARAVGMSEQMANELVANKISAIPGIEKSVADKVLGGLKTLGQTVGSLTPIGNAMSQFVPR